MGDQETNKPQMSLEEMRKVHPERFVDFPVVLPRNIVETVTTVLNRQMGIEIDEGMRSGERTPQDMDDPLESAQQRFAAAFSSGKKESEVMVCDYQVQGIAFLVRKFAHDDNLGAKEIEEVNKTSAELKNRFDQVARPDMGRGFDSALLRLGMNRAKQSFD